MRIFLACFVLLVSALAHAARPAAPLGAGSASAATGAAAARAALYDKKVLVLVPFSFGRAGLDVFVRNYVDGLLNSGVSSENIMVEYLNLNRNTDPDYTARLRDLLVLQYAGKKIDLVFALQQPALDYALRELREVAPTAPVIAVGTATPDVQTIGAHTVLALNAELSARGTIDQALTLFPATEKILVVVGASPHDQTIKRDIELGIASMGQRIEAEYTDHLDFAGMQARAAQAKPGTLILYASVNRDITGAFTSSAEMSDRIAAVGSAPGFVLYSIGVGGGPVGGLVQRIETVAQGAAMSSIRLISGERQLSPGITSELVRSVSMYDWRALQRWRADPERLPPDTIFLNRPRSIWIDYRPEVMASAAVIAVLSFLLVGMGIQQRRLRSAETQARESEARFRVLVENAPEAVVVYDVDLERFIDCNKKAAQLFGCSKEVLLAGGYERFYTDEQPDGLPPAVSVPKNVERGLAGEELVLERSVRSMDGRVFPCEVSLVALPAAERRLLRGRYVDISARKTNEARLAQHRFNLEELVEQRTAALSTALHDAEAANRAKSTFLASMSHELRTPLNAVIGFSQSMADSTSLFDEEKRQLSLINRSGHHLLGLINDILEYSKIEAGQVGLEIAVADLAGLLEEVLDTVRDQAAAKDIGLRLDCPALLPRVKADAGKLRQVLHNLCSNAVKYTEHGSITLSLAVQDQGPNCTLAFAVTDSGAGIGEADRERIFTPFVQGATPHTHGGTGLGLAISREFIGLMGGALKVQSEPGAGSTFSFVLRLARAEGAMQPARTADAGAGSHHAHETTRLSAGQLGILPAALRSELRIAVQELNLARAEELLEGVHGEHPELGKALARMLAQHQYRELHAMLEPA